MTTKFKVDIHTNGTLNDKVIRLISNHNSGAINVNLGIFGMLVKVEYSLWPSIMPEIQIKENVGEHTMQIIEGEKHTLTITECTYEELAMDEVNQSAEILN